MFLVQNLTFLRRQYFSITPDTISECLNICLRRNNRVTFNTRKFAITTKTLVTNNVESVHDYLENIGANVTKIEKEIRLAKLGGKVNLKSLVEVLHKQCDLEPTEIGRMVSKRPRIVLLDQEKVKSCVDMLRNVGLKKRDIASMLKKSPGILTSRVEETLEEKLNILYNLNVLPPFSKKDVLKIIKKCPALISTCTPSSLEDKINFLQKNLGFYRRQLRNMLLKQPSILTFSQDNIKTKFDYCFQDMGMEVADIARCPRLWQCSLKRLKERYMFLCHLKLITDNTHIDDFGLGKIVTPSDSAFAELVAKKSLVEFQEFARNIVIE